MGLTIVKKKFEDLITYSCDDCGRNITAKYQYIEKDGDKARILCKHCAKTIKGVLKHNDIVSSMIDWSKSTKESYSDIVTYTCALCKKTYQSKTKYFAVAEGKTIELCSKCARIKQSIEKNESKKQQFVKAGNPYKCVADGCVIGRGKTCPFCKEELVQKDVSVQLYNKNNKPVRVEKIQMYFCENCYVPFYEYKKNSSLRNMGYHVATNGIKKELEANLWNILSSSPYVEKTQITKTIHNKKENISQYSTQDTRNVADNRATTKKEHQISKSSFIVLSSVKRCMSLNHRISDVEALVDVMTPEIEIVKMEISAGYCDTCKRYFILNEEYQKLLAKGIILCNVIKEDDKGQVKHIEKSISQWNKESILHKLGYNVDSSQNLSATKRHKILSKIIDCKILTRVEICTHLDMLIRLHQSKKEMQAACIKWKEDRKFVADYKNTSRVKIIQAEDKYF